MDERLRHDLSLSHAFINALSAYWHGAYVFEQALAGFGLPEAEARAARVANQIDSVNAWWVQFKRRVPLVRRDAELSPAGRQAWRMLEEATGNLESLSGELMAPIDPATMLSDRAAMSLRVAAQCDVAYSREQYVHGLICFGEVMSLPLVVGRYRQLLPSCQQGVRDAHGYLERAVRLEAVSLEQEMAELLDATLTVPVLIGQRILDLRQVLGRYRGDFGFTDAGIADGDRSSWERRGFSAYDAGMWHSAGFSAPEATCWIDHGVGKALGAAGFHWRGIEPDIASVWYARGLSGRDAAAWLDSGVDIEAAAAWRAQGVSHPDGRHRTA